MIKTKRMAWLCLGCLGLFYPTFAQKTDSTQHVLQFKSTVTATNNGFSFIPSFSLGKPAAMVALSVSNGRRLSFEPEFRFDLEGRPWSFIFIWRYKLIKQERFSLTVGTHLPAMNFKKASVIKNGAPLDVVQVTRFFPVVEVLPAYQLGRHISMSMFGLFGNSLSNEGVQKSYFLSWRTNFTRIPLFKGFYLRALPQLYYLKSDAHDGVYGAATIGLAKQGLPFSIGAMFNKAIETDVPGKDFDWNISLNYAFGRDYARK